jgi:hypothetical protein
VSLTVRKTESPSRMNIARFNFRALAASGFGSATPA